MAIDPMSIPLTIIIPLFIWEMVWKGIALWKCGRNKHLAWFVVLFIVNTIGILPIIYLVWFQEKPAAPLSHKPAKKNKK